MNYSTPPQSRVRRFSGMFLSAAFLISLLSPVAVLAESITVKSFRAPVEVQRVKIPNKWFPARVGLELTSGDTIRTGAGARADIRMGDGSKMILGSSSRLTVQEVAPSRVMGLDFGRVKAWVKKLKGGNKFEVKTPIAAASVRGTQFEIGYDEEGKTGFLDVTEGAVALLKDGREVLVPAGARMEFVPDSPLGEPVPARSQGSLDEREGIRREVGLGMSKEEVMSAAAEEMRLAEYQEGKTLIDVNGARVRLEEYIIRRPVEIAAADRDKAFKLVVLNERDDRFDYFYYRGLFNATLPEDLSVALKDINGKLGTDAPSYYLTAYEMGQSNTMDYIKDTASGGHLVKVTYDGTNYILTDPANASNTRTVAKDEQTVLSGVTYHKIYDPVNDRFFSLTDAQYNAGDYNAAVYDPSNDSFKYIASGDTYWRTRYNTYSHVINGASKQSYTPKTAGLNTLAIDLDATFTYAGGTLFSFTETPSGSDVLHNRVSLYYGDGTKEVYDTYIISDEGVIGPVSAFNNMSSGSAFKSELLKWNYEQVAGATEFNGRKIDLVVEPKILIKSGLIK